MKVFKTIAVILTVALLFMFSKTNKYPVTDYYKGEALVLRKNCLIKMNYFKSVEVGDSIRLYADYDWNWKPISYCR